MRSVPFTASPTGVTRAAGVTGNISRSLTTVRKLNVCDSVKSGSIQFRLWPWGPRGQTCPFVTCLGVRTGPELGDERGVRVFPRSRQSPGGPGRQAEPACELAFTYSQEENAVGVRSACSNSELLTGRGASLCDSHCVRGETRASEAV